MILKVFVSDVILKEDVYGRDSCWVFGRLQSGTEVIIDDYYHDLRKWIGRRVDMLLSFMRSPYSEQKRGIQNHIFLPEEYYSVELHNELLRKSGGVSTGGESVIILTGQYITPYIIPEKWAPLPQRGSFQTLFKEPSALKTDDGTFLLYPIHSQRRVPIEQIPQEVTMAGGLSLEAWTPNQ